MSMGKEVPPPPRSRRVYETPWGVHIKFGEFSRINWEVWRYRIDYRFM
jgi:hypothetical protein